MAQAPRAPRAIGSDDYTGVLLILICVGLAILGWAGWKVWHAEISMGALVVAHREMQAIAWVSDRFLQADVAVQRANPAGVEFGVAPADRHRAAGRRNDDARSWPQGSASARGEKRRRKLWSASDGR